MGQAARGRPSNRVPASAFRERGWGRGVRGAGVREAGERG